MKTTKQYPMVCPSCCGNGFINNPQGGWTCEIMITCPACLGSKIVIVTETNEYNEPVYKVPETTGG